jgi:hypothetical protein
MANRHTDGGRRSERNSSTDDDMVRGRADETDDLATDTETDEFDDTEDLDDEAEEEGAEGDF